MERGLLECAYPFGGWASREIEGELLDLERRGLIEICCTTPLSDGFGFTLTKSGREAIKND